ncbi:MAG: UDP-N-acetylglucosamine 2-epimerase (non-hydrolyzing) [Actinomycetota bacterium]|nr:UDP-N-acetylglucosamine 2-epimerase (non-hydrolyzing) [Actinomycetota bacterium]MDK1096225.1 UDP-N-acetylglucosamine 2-epimerase (non-hydrolyzing) [Actinomycetota bacterium]MDK1103213.1 UDP-N-acetylglucosamine 2-epimerase (non-hydrolyzing) [Actinomycetota bacterium]
MKPTVMTVLGTRPQFIKAAPVTRTLTQVADEYLVNTGQHYDAEMSSAFFDEHGIPEPHIDLGVGSGEQGAQTGRMLEALEAVMLERGPDVVQVYGDTNSTLAGALAAVKLGIPVAHVEAGLRSWRRDMPEEINRVVTDHVSSLLLCPTETAVENLRREGITSGVELVGDVTVDAVHAVLGRLNRSRLDGLAVPDRFIAATMHRPANVDSRERLAQALDLFGAMPLPVAIAVHPRTEAAMKRFGLAWPANVIALKPLGYLDMLTLVRFADTMLTDSGGLQKETIIVGTPCVVLRDETEWVETVEQGMSRLVGLDRDAALDAVRTLAVPDRDAIDALFPPGASRRIADLIADLAG